MKKFSITKKRLNTILIATIIMLFINSLEAFTYVKDISYYERFVNEIHYITQADFNLLNAFKYILSTLIFIVYAIFCYLNYTKGFFTKIFKWTFNVLFLSEFLRILISFDTGNIFYILKLSMIIILLYLNQTMERTKQYAKTPLR